MSQTKAQLVNPQGDLTLTSLLVGVGATFSGNVSIAGTLTKQDVTNVDSVGLITARSGIKVTGGGINVSSGVVTATSFSGSGANLTGIDATALKDGGGSVKVQATTTGAVITGVATATSFVGGLPITNGADNRVITSSSASAIQGEANLTFANSGSDPVLTITNSGHAQLQLTNTSGSDSCSINFGDNDDNDVGDITYGHSDNIMRFYTNGNNERLRLGNAGEIGIGGANYGTSGQVITSGGSGSAPSWAAVPPGGNVLTGIASGAIANNRCVKICDDGKFTEIKGIISGQNATYASDTYVTTSGGDHTEGVVVYDPDQHKVITYYTDSDFTTNNMEYSVLSIITSGASKGNTNSVQSERQKVETEIKSYPHGFEWGDAGYDTNNNKHLWIGRDMNDNKVYAKTGAYNTSNNTITWEQTGRSNCSQPLGSGNNGRAPRIHFDETTNRIVALIRDDSSSNRPTVVIGTYNTSTNTIDWGTKQQLSTDSISDQDTVICKGGNATGQVFVGWKNNSNIYKANLITVSNSSNTCTISTAQQIHSSANTYRVAYNVADNNIITGFKDGNDSNKGKLARLTVNSGATGYDVSSLLQFCINPNDSGHDVMYSISAKQVFVTFRPSVGSATNQVFRVNNTTGTPTKAADENISNAGDVGNFLYSKGASSTYTDTAGKLYGMYTRSNESMPCTSYNVSQSTSNLTDGNHYLGFADQAYTDGQTATIKTVGNTATTLSGLTAGTKYYVKNDGSLQTSADSPSALAGLALSATKLLIREPKSDV